MAETRKTKPSAPDIDASILFGIYLSIQGNEDLKYDDFINFLTTESVDRQLFLNKHCDYKFIEKEDSIILMYNVKE